jgi:hypothetical protein
MCLAPKPLRPIRRGPTSPINRSSYKGAQPLQAHPHKTGPTLETTRNRHAHLRAMGKELEVLPSIAPRPNQAEALHIVFRESSSPSTCSSSAAHPFFGIADSTLPLGQKGVSIFGCGNLDAFPLIERTLSFSSVSTQYTAAVTNACHDAASVGSYAGADQAHDTEEETCVREECDSMCSSTSECPTPLATECTSLSTPSSPRPAGRVKEQPISFPDTLFLPGFE